MFVFVLPTECITPSVYVVGNVTFYVENVKKKKKALKLDKVQLFCTVM